MWDCDTLNGHHETRFDDNHMTVQVIAYLRAGMSKKANDWPVDAMRDLSYVE